MIRTVSLWIRPKGCSSQIKPTYLDNNLQIRPVKKPDQQ
jgi:hypothetical protein